MNVKNRSFKIAISVLLIVTLLIVVISLYKESKNKLLDKKLYKTYVSQIEEASSSWTSNDDMKTYITSWADENKLDYTVDNAGNIIFTKEASTDKTDVPPVITAVSYNYKTAPTNSRSLATAQAIAISNLNAGKYSVIFFNNDNGYGDGYKNISKKYFSDNTKVIYLDYGKNAYMSTKSFAGAGNTISIPCKTDAVTCDTAIKIRISGIASGELGTNNNQPNPITALGVLLSRLNNKSITYQLADIKVDSSGYMYPTGIEATILLNSYSLTAFTSYIDERSEKYIKNYKDDFPNISYEYEVIESKADLPSQAYSKEAASALNSVLYTLKNGAYKFTEENLLDGYDVDDTYAVNNIVDLRLDGDNLVLTLGTMGLTDDLLGDVLRENSTAAALAEANASIVARIPAFSNESSKLKNELSFAYIKVNDQVSRNIIIKGDYDKQFTPCAYLQEINSKMDIVHLRQDEACSTIYANTLLCFIQDQGNFLSL